MRIEAATVWLTAMQTAMPRFKRDMSYVLWVVRLPAVFAGRRHIRCRTSSTATGIRWCGAWRPIPLCWSLPSRSPRPVTGLAADFGSMDLTLNVMLYAPGSDTPVKLSETYRDQPPDPRVEMKFDNAPAQVSRLRVEILNLLAGETANIHIREFQVLP